MVFNVLGCLVTVVLYCRRQEEISATVLFLASVSSVKDDVVLHLSYLTRVYIFSGTTILTESVYYKADDEEKFCFVHFFLLLVDLAHHANR